MNKGRMLNRTLEILFFGSCWGINEVVIENYLVPITVIPRSLILSTIAIFILSVMRSDIPRPGIFLATGIVAALYKFLNVRFFGCQMIALVMLSGCFEIVHLWFFKRVRNTGFVGSITILLFNCTFALVALFILKSSWWVTDSGARIIRFIFLEGGITAILAYWAYLLGAKLRIWMLSKHSMLSSHAHSWFRFLGILFPFSAAIIVTVI